MKLRLPLASPDASVRAAMRTARRAEIHALNRSASRTQPDRALAVRALPVRAATAVRSAVSSAASKAAGTMIHVKHLRLWPVALCVLLGLGAGAAHAMFAERQYAVSGHVVVTSAEGGDPEAAVGFAQAYGRIATDGAVLHQAHGDAGVSADVLRGRVRAVVSPDSPVIEITGTASRPEDAARAANAVARALVAHGRRQEAAAGTGVRLSQLTEAHAPGSPLTPSPLVSLGTGVSAGVLAGALLWLSRRPSAPASTPAAGPAPATPAAPSAAAALAT